MPEELTVCHECYDSVVISNAAHVDTLSIGRCHYCCQLSVEPALVLSALVSTTPYIYQ